ncbi:DNA replication complex GINS protein PSF3 [Habropoda laboriosa]|uniref:DNA replication complex GINS protein PSF3 n=1 Tax=Habropoda laboriosa TaxID=597456 RepID=A0A0L7R0G1_9HYME|nr:DNA replication complex GINS protein PSF3 [Habropoda laboriosa]
MACYQSYTPDYFSVNDILCTEERISCTIEVELLGLGFLDTSSQTEDIKVGSKVEFPLWLAESLKSLQNSVVSVDIPKIYKEGYREFYFTFKSRFRVVMDWAQNPISDPTLGNQLPRLERDLFLSGRKAKVRLLEWLKMGTNSILPSEITANLKKRKRANYELD